MYDFPQRLILLYACAWDACKAQIIQRRACNVACTIAKAAYACTLGGQISSQRFSYHIAYQMAKLETKLGHSHCTFEAKNALLHVLQYTVC